MITLETCAREWDAAGQHGLPEERIARAKQWLPYYDYLAGRQMGRPYAPDGSDDFIEALRRDGILGREISVLDIGAGMGGYALEMAQHCRSVTALEISEACLDVLRSRAAQCGIGTIQPICGAWETFQPAQRYDFVFSAMCPAICNVEELRRMERVSRRACCLVTVMRGSTDKHRGPMMAELGIRPKGGMVTEAIHYFNALYLMGRQPNVRCRTIRQTYDVDAETVLTQYPIYFSIFGVDKRESRAYLEKYLAQHGDGGVLHDESTLRQAMITWEVDGNGQ